MYKITKRFSFAAAHSLPELPPEHKCHRKHGHNYVVELELRSAHLDPMGMVLDYAELDVFKRWLDETLDHRDLDTWMYDAGGGQSTAENLARELFVVASDLDPRIEEHLCQVTVKETDGTSATFSGSASA